MLFSQLITSSDVVVLRGGDREITGVTADSREVKPGYLFMAISGSARDGKDFIPDALAKGAVAVLLEEGGAVPEIPEGVVVAAVKESRAAVSLIASRFWPRQPDNIAAVTGTSGKTSTAQFAREIWQANGHLSASVGTLGLVTAREKKYGSLTTPDAVTLHRTLHEAALGGVTHLSLEASSHGIVFRRLDNVWIKAAGFTNLSRDHLDFHGDMDSYFSAKTELFSRVMAEGGAAVLNADIPQYEALEKACRDRRLKVISYGRNGRDIRLTGQRHTENGQELDLEAMGGKTSVFLPVMGGFQAWNAMCALGMAIGCGEDAMKSANALAKVTSVPGRLDLAGTTGNGAAVFVDYAHKPGALENVLMALRPHVEARRGKLHVAFGCGGNRDSGKRPIMGEIAVRLADKVVVTDDNPRREEAAAIRREVMAGCQNSSSVREIGDRAQAIRAAIADLGAGDVLVIAGKGHETGQIVGDKVLPFDDMEVARDALQL